MTVWTEKKVITIRYEMVDTAKDFAVELDTDEEIISIETINKYHRIVYIGRAREVSYFAD